MLRFSYDVKICVVTLCRSFIQPKQTQPTTMEWMQIDSLLVNEASKDKPYVILQVFVYLTSCYLVQLKHLWVRDCFGKDYHIMLKEDVESKLNQNAD